MNCHTPRLPVRHQLPEFTQTHVHQGSDAIQPSHLLSSPSPPAPNPSQHQVFSNESALHIRWPKYWSFIFNISPSKERPGLISFRMDWLDLLAIQGTLKSLLQHHSSKASILQCSAFFTVQLSHPNMTTGKTIALTSIRYHKSQGTYCTVNGSYINWIYKSKPSSVLKGCMCLSMHVGSLVGRVNAKSNQNPIDAGAWNTQNQKMTQPLGSSKTHCACICVYQPVSKWLGCAEVTPIISYKEMPDKNSETGLLTSHTLAPFHANTSRRPPKSLML